MQKIESLPREGVKALKCLDSLSLLDDMPFAASDVPPHYFNVIYKRHDR
ncbi:MULTISPECIES: hypothetical protein [unclassified Mesorhizobium]|nr:MULTISPECIES: hypothetical protein [unclassified Mesorhizobium]